MLLVLDGSTIAVSWNSPNLGPLLFHELAIHRMHRPATRDDVRRRRGLDLLTTAAGYRRHGGICATFMMFMIAMDWSNATRQFSPIEVYDKLNEKNRVFSIAPSSVDFTAHNYPAVATAMALLIFVAALMGWWALRSYSPRRATA